MTCKSSSSTQQPPLKTTSHPTTRISRIHQIYSRKKERKKSNLKRETKQKFFHQKKKKRKKEQNEITTTFIPFQGSTIIVYPTRNFSKFIQIHPKDAQTGLKISCSNNSPKNDHKKRHSEKGISEETNAITPPPPCELAESRDDLEFTSLLLTRVGRSAH